MSRRVRFLFLLTCAAGLTAAAVSSAADADPRRPPAVQTEEVPAVPAEIFAQLNRYQNVRQAGFAGWAPDGTGILLRTRFGNTLQLHRVYQPGGRREQITFFDEPVGGGFIPEAQDGALLLSASQGGNENNQIYFFDVQQARTALLTDGRSRNLLGPVRQDGSQMIVHSNQRNGRDTDLYLVDPRQTDVRPDAWPMLLQVDGEFWSATDWSSDGRQVALVRTVSANESYAALLEVATKKVTPLPAAVESPEKSAVKALAFAADGRSLFLTTDARGEFQELARFDLSTKKYHWLSADLPHDVEEIEVDPHAGTLAFTTNEDGVSGLYVMPPQGMPRRVQTPLARLSSLEFSPDGQSLGLTVISPDAPADAFSLDLSSEKLTQWSYSEPGGLDPRRFIRPDRISWKSFDGLSIPGWIYRPRDAGPARRAPVLIDIHGGPEGQYEPFFSGATQYLAGELGLAVIHPNVRGSSGYGKTYLKKDNVLLREDSVKDIGALLDWIAEQPDLDPQRVAVTGGSYGGYMVLASLVHFGERIRAGIDVVGIANFTTFLERTSPYRQDLRRVEYGDERDPEVRAFFERINPTSQAEKIRSALLVAHGVNDPRVPFSEAQQIAERVRSQGRPVWTVYAENEGHGFGKKDNRDYLQAVEVLFLKKHLGLE